MDYDSPPDQNIKISVHWYLKLLYIVGIAFFGGMAIWCQITTHVIGLSLFLAGFALLEIWALLLSFSTIQINRESIVVNAPHGVYKINWNEVKTIETNGISIAFFGDNKCLAINLGMAGKRKVEFRKFLEDQIQQRQIIVKPLSSQWIRQKNTKVRRSMF